MLTLVAASFFGGAPSGPKFSGFDKLAHFCVFGLIATLLFRPLRLPFGLSRRWLLAMAGTLLFGALDELLQYFNPARSFDPWDWVADVSGAALALALYRYWAWYRSLLEWPLWGRLAKR